MQYLRKSISRKSLSRKSSAKQPSFTDELAQEQLDYEAEQKESKSAGGKSKRSASKSKKAVPKSSKASSRHSLVYEDDASLSLEGKLRARARTSVRKSAAYGSKSGLKRESIRWDA